jgi:hypothetical protein
MASRSRRAVVAGAIVVVGALWLLLTVSLREPRAASPQKGPSRPIEEAIRPESQPPPVEAPQNPASAAKDPHPEQLTAFFRKAVGEYRRQMSEPQHGLVGRFSVELIYKLRELRLLALGYPEAIKGQAGSLAQDASADVLERFAALYVLGILRGGGDKEAESLLIRLSEDGDERIASEAVGNLASTDDQGVHRVLYRRKAQAGVTKAIRELPYWPDPETSTTLRGILAALPQGKQQPAYGIRLAAENALQRIGLLESAAGQREVLAIIEDHKKDSRSTPWALRAARVNSLSGALDAMRRRLDAGLQNATDTIERERASALRSLELPSLSNEFTQTTTRLHSEDQYFDEVLLAYSQMGGKLSPPEQKRLEYFGYACDPRKRLAELMAER